MGFSPISKAHWEGEESLGTTYEATALTVQDADKGPVGLGALWVFMEDLSGASSLSVFLSRDAAGDEVIVPEYDADISLGHTDNTKGAAVVTFDRIPYCGSDAIYVWMRTDAGTVTITEIQLTLTKG